MKNTINFTDFTDAFLNMNRQEQFTYEGKKALFEYLEEYEESTGEEVELDVIALCCEYSEYSDIEELFNEYTNLFDDEFEAYEEDSIVEEFNNRTMVLNITGGGYIIQQF